MRFQREEVFKHIIMSMCVWEVVKINEGYKPKEKMHLEII